MSNFSKAEIDLFSNISNLINVNKLLKQQLDSFLYLKYSTETELVFTCNLESYTFKQFNIQDVTNAVNTSNFFARNEKRNRMNPSSITLNKAGISAMPLQLQRRNTKPNRQNY
ncbi:Hypothetical_protein [Hexamita inflata]|uniref:Hypothetical_protein n=1 Tax=Hexamita inflata TaxID=28002 RepID=A0AA86QRX6_9EUKA|nr:Hypothetical protein HINF_LOCUS52519 [Hexamita inflata]